MHDRYEPPNGGTDRPLEFDASRGEGTPPCGRRATETAGPEQPVPARPSASGRRFREMDDRSRRRRARLFGVLALLAGSAYLALLPGSLNPEAPWVSRAYLLAEVGLLGLFLLVVVDLWTLRFKPPEGLRSSTYRPVDVFIHVSDQADAVVERALTSAACLDWPGPREAYVLDESGRLSLQVRARELGFAYLATRREGARRGRASALNHGLARSRGDLVFVLDADHVVRSEALTAMAGYLDVGRIAFVQARSGYDGPGADPFREEHAPLAHTMQLGFDGGHSVISCGSTALYAREALEEVGGFADWNLNEGLATSYELHRRGWRSLYFPYPMSRGIAPANVVELYRRRVGKAADALRIFIWSNPLLQRGMSWRSRLDHFALGFGYLWAALFLPVLCLIPIWTYVTGTPVLVANEAQVVLGRLAYFGVFTLACGSLCVGRGLGEHLRFLSGLFPVYLGGLAEALITAPGAHRRTPSAGASQRRPPPVTLWLVLAPQVLIVAANLTLPAFALVRHAASTWVVAANVMMSAAVVWALWPLLFQGLRQRGEARDAVRRVRLGARASALGGTP